MAQEAFVIAYRSLGTWRGDGPLGAWLARIAVRLAVRRASQREHGRLARPACRQRDLPGQDRYRSAGRGDAVDPAHTVLRTERDARLRAAVASLDEPYREVVALRFFAERSLAEIAEIHRPAAGDREDAPPQGSRTPPQRARGVRPMTGQVPGSTPRRFSPSELDDVSGIRSDDLAAEVRVARELDTIAARTTVVPSAAFADRVMEAIAAEPSPAPVRSAGTALRHGAIGALLASIRDAWRVTTRPGFPMAVRAQAMALVLVVVVLGAGSAAATAGRCA